MEQILNEMELRRTSEDEDKIKQEGKDIYNIYNINIFHNCDQCFTERGEHERRW